MQSISTFYCGIPAPSPFENPAVLFASALPVPLFVREYNSSIKISLDFEINSPYLVWYPKVNKAKLFYFFIFSIHHYLFICLSILWFNLRCRQSSMKTNWCPAQTKILTMHTWSRWRLKEPRNTKSLSQAKVCVCVCVCTKNVISNTHSALRTDADTTGPSLFCKKIFSTVSFVLTKFQL